MTRIELSISLPIVKQNTCHQQSDHLHPNYGALFLAAWAVFFSLKANANLSNTRCLVRVLAQSSRVNRWGNPSLRQFELAHWHTSPSTNASYSGASQFGSPSSFTNRLVSRLRSSPQRFLALILFQTLPVDGNLAPNVNGIDCSSVR